MSAPRTPELMAQIREAHEHAKLEWADAVQRSPAGGSLRTMGTCGTTLRTVTAGDRYAASQVLAPPPVEREAGGAGTSKRRCPVCGKAECSGAYGYPCDGLLGSAVLAARRVK